MKREQAVLEDEKQRGSFGRPSSGIFRKHFQVPSLPKCLEMWDFPSCQIFLVFLWMQIAQILALAMPRHSLRKRVWLEVTALESQGKSDWI